jgi:hypothetical protein
VSDWLGTVIISKYAKKQASCGHNVAYMLQSSRQGEGREIISNFMFNQKATAVNVTGRSDGV